MRVLAYILILIGIYALARAGYDEFRGVTGAPVMFGHASYPLIVDLGRIHKKDNPEEFHHALTYHWFYASMLVFAGAIAYIIDRGQEKSDPMSPDSDEHIDEELRKDELDKKETNAKEQH